MIAAEIDLGSQLRLGSGELKSGGFRRKSILADALEALFGAVYLDGGFDAAAGVVERLFVPRLDRLPERGRAERSQDASAGGAAGTRIALAFIRSRIHLRRGAQSGLPGALLGQLAGPESFGERCRAAAARSRPPRNCC